MSSSSENEDASATIARVSAWTEMQRRNEVIPKYVGLQLVERPTGNGFLLKTLAGLDRAILSVKQTRLDGSIGAQMSFPHSKNYTTVQTRTWGGLLQSAVPSFSLTKLSSQERVFGSFLETHDCRKE
eukprot:IDg11031t1